MRLLPLDPVTIAQTLTEWQASYPQMGVMALLPEAEKGQCQSFRPVAANLACH
ncbi:MAG: hypothetical protein IPJ18_20680 [Betaproteobacteria bacterium]|nr:hypothetical protein [Betaproteobacteria bacterium]